MTPRPIPIFFLINLVDNWNLRNLPAPVLCMPPTAPGAVASGHGIDDAVVHPTDAPLLDVMTGGSSHGHSSLRESLMPREHAAGQGARVQGNSERRRSALDVGREVAHELLFVKSDVGLYHRPFLRKPGQILEGLLLCAIFLALALSIADSFNSLEIDQPESHCWYHCCQTYGHCSTETCAKHQNEANETSSTDGVCDRALLYTRFRDDATWVLLFVFSLEYVLRVWCCIEDSALPRHAVKGRVAWMRQPMPVVDILSLIPFYIDRIYSEHPGGLHQPNFLRTIRLFRIFSVFRWERPLRAMGIMADVCHRKREELGVTLFGAMLIILILGSLMYAIEAEGNAEMFPNIPSAMWWCVTCLSTVGYGDVVPRTWAGKLLGCLAAFLGVGLFAMPAGILGSGFLEVYEERKAERDRRRLAGHQAASGPDSLGASKDSSGQQTLGADQVAGQGGAMLAPVSHDSESNTALGLRLRQVPSRCACVRACVRSRMRVRVRVCVRVRVQAWIWPCLPTAGSCSHVEHRSLR